MAEEKPDVDALLDAFLESYSRSEPRPGLEQRVLATLRVSATANQKPRRRAAWIWTTLAAAAVILIAAGLVLILPKSREPKRVAEGGGLAVAPASPLPPPAVSPVRRAPGPRLKEPRPRTAVLRRPLFPSPAVLSAEEKLLLRYVAQTPRDEQQARSGFLDPPPEIPSSPESKSTP